MNITAFIQCPGCPKSYEKPLSYICHLKCQHSDEPDILPFVDAFYKYVDHLSTIQRQGTREKNSIIEHEMLPKDLDEYKLIFAKVGVSFVSWVVNRIESIRMLDGYDWGFFLQFVEYLYPDDDTADNPSSIFFSKPIPVYDPSEVFLKSSFVFDCGLIINKKKRTTTTTTKRKRQRNGFLKPMKSIRKRDDFILESLKRNFACHDPTLRDSLRKRIYSRSFHSC